MADIIDVNIGDQVLEVFWQDEVELNLDMDLMYIKSGQKEIQDYVDNVSKPEINDYVETEAKPLVSRIVIEIAEPTVNEYLETTVKPEIDNYVEDKKPELQAFVIQAQGFANDSHNSAEASAASAAVAETALTTLTTTATDNFNTNASEKQAQIDASANAAKVSETNSKASETAAKTSETNSKIWAEGTDSQVQGLGGVHSSKVWSETAQAVVAGKQDIANLSQTLDNSTTKYPSNNAVKKAIDAKESLPDQTGNADKFLKTDGTTASWAEIGGGLEIGDIGFAPLGIDETQNKRRYLNGQVISQTQFATFAGKVKAAVALYPSLSATETNWQAEVTNSKLGQCGKFVIDDTAGTIRLPCVVNAQGLVDLASIGGIKSESLPTAVALVGYNGVSGEFRQKVANYTYTSDSHQGNTSAPMSSETTSGSQVDYLNDKPVQQEAVQYPYFIQVATGSEESVDVSTEIQLNNPFFFGMHIWSDTAISNASWLISNGSYHSGATYVDFYQWLLKIHNGTLTVDGVSVKAYGASGITDYDYVINTSNTTFRLPVKVKLASGNAVVGNGMTLGLKSRTYTAGLTTVSASNASLDWTASAYGVNAGSAIYGTGPTVGTIGITTDPTKSGIETSSSGLKLYFYVGETVQDANVINAAGVLTRVANSIDRTVASDRETVVGWGMPDYTAGVSKAWNTNITAEKDGVVIANAGANQSTTLKATVNGNQLPYDEIANYGHLSISFVVSKGDVYKVYGANGTGTIVFYPLKGVN